MNSSKINFILLISFLLILAGSNSYSAISEKELKKYGNSFLTKIIKDNPGYKRKIIKFMNGIIRSDNSGIKLIDKFALFIYDSKKNGIYVNKAKFLYDNDLFYLFIVFKDKEEGEYTLFLEYKFNRKNNICTLKDVYFSLVFNEKKENIENFFRYR